AVSIEVDGGSVRWQVDIGAAAALVTPWRSAPRIGDDGLLMSIPSATPTRLLLLDPHHGGRERANVALPSGARLVYPLPHGAAALVNAPPSLRLFGEEGAARDFALGGTSAWLAGVPIDYFGLDRQWILAGDDPKP